MALTQTRTKAQGTGGQAGVFGPAIVILAVVAAIILATGLVAKPNGGQVAAHDPLRDPATIAFRRDEHAALSQQGPLNQVSAHDPLRDPATIAFRRDEHAALSQQQPPRQPEVKYRRHRPATGPAR
jgi:hypothetical protein